VGDVEEGVFESGGKQLAVMMMAKAAPGGARALRSGEMMVVEEVRTPLA
jgi:hypothetical protein